MADTNIATLVSGYARIENADLVGLSVATARSRYATVASIPTGARAQVNGREASGEKILAAGDILVFDQPTGTKG